MTALWLQKQQRRWQSPLHYNVPFIQGIGCRAVQTQLHRWILTTNRGDFLGEPFFGDEDVARAKLREYAAQQEAQPCTA
jgi:hypothetical protein